MTTRQFKACFALALLVSFLVGFCSSARGQVLIDGLTLSGPGNAGGNIITNWGTNMWSINSVVTEAGLSNRLATYGVPSNLVMNLTSSNGTVVVNGSGTNADLHVPAATSALAQALSAYSAATSAAAQALAAYSAATSALAQVVSGASTTGFVQRVGDLMTGPLTVQGGILSTSTSESAYGSYVASMFSEPGVGYGLAMIDTTLGSPRFVLAEGSSPTSAVYSYLVMSPTATGKLARMMVSGGLTYFYDLVDSSTFAPADYLKASEFSAWSTNAMKLHGAAPTGATASGSAGQVVATSKDSTSVWVYTFIQNAVGGSNRWSRDARTIEWVP